METVFFTSIQPNPISAKSGDSITLKISLDTSSKVNAASLVIASEQPNVLKLFDNNSSIPRQEICTNLGAVSPNTDCTCQIGFHLIQNTSPAGSIVGLTLHIEDTTTQQKLSSDETVLSTITP